MKVLVYQASFKDSLKERYTSDEINELFIELLSSFLSRSRMQIREMMMNNQELPSESLSTLEEALLSLQKGVPLQQITGKSRFYGLDFKVNKNVLIPRPETEELIEWATENNTKDHYSIIDIGTGSGAIAIALKNSYPHSEIVAIDVSPLALEIAKENARLLNKKVDFRSIDFLNEEEWKAQQFSSFDIIISNPPYIMKGDWVDENVNTFEPHIALYVQEDPLIFYRKIIKFAKEFLSKNGEIYVEINQYLGKETQSLFEEFFEEVTLKKDLSANDRMIRAKHYKK